MDTNSPFKEPVRHFQFTENGITNEIVASRRAQSTRQKKTNSSSSPLAQNGKKTALKRMSLSTRFASVLPNIDREVVFQNRRKINHINPAIK